MKTARPIRPVEELRADKWLTMAEACRYLKKSVNTVKALLVAGLIKGDKQGTWLIDRESIDAFLNRKYYHRDSRLGDFMAEIHGQGGKG